MDGWRKDGKTGRRKLEKSLRAGSQFPAAKIIMMMMSYAGRCAKT